MRLSFIVAALAAAAPASAPAQVPAPPKTMQWLHGSSEAVALQRLTFRSLAAFAIEAHLRRSLQGSVESAVLADGASLSAPAWRQCAAGQASAVVFDIDETALLNTGWNYDSARRGDPPFDAAAAARWTEWEQSGVDMVEPLPGAKEAIDALRGAGLTVVFISNRDRLAGTTDIADKTAAALRGAGLGEAKPGETLFLKGDVAPGSGKDPRRGYVAGKYCVLALAGDQFGDFSDAFNAPRTPQGKTDVRARRALADTAAVAARLGRGWFLIPNPVYGPGVDGGYDDLFEPSRRWPKEK